MAKDKANKKEEERKLKKYKARFGDDVIPRNGPIKKGEHMDNLMFTREPYQLDAIEVLKKLFIKIKKEEGDKKKKKEMMQMYNAYHSSIEHYCLLNEIPFKRNYDYGILPLNGKEGIYTHTLAFHLIVDTPELIGDFLSHHLDHYFRKENRLDYLRHELLDVLKRCKIFSSYDENIDEIKVWIKEERKKIKEIKHPDHAKAKIEDVLRRYSDKEIIEESLIENKHLKAGVLVSDTFLKIKLKALLFVLMDKGYFNTQTIEKCGMALANWLNVETSPSFSYKGRMFDEFEKDFKLQIPDIE